MKKKKKKAKGIEHHLEKAGVRTRPEWFKRILFGLCLLINMAISIYLLSFFTQESGYPAAYVFIIIILVWAVIFFLLLTLIWLCFYLAIDLRIFKRTKSVEEVLPDFLQLTATNVRAGMTIDKALWFAIRPRFGILSKEIEIVAKEVMSGNELTDALQAFADKYDSDILKKSINLLIEGINAGSEIGDLLTRIAQNIQEVRTIQKEMSANVTTYVIFITFAAVVASPVLLALSKQLIIIIGGFVSSIGNVPSSSILTTQESSISPKDFQVFAVVVTLITSLCSAMIVSIIKKGNIKEGLKYLPTYMIVSILLYFFAAWVLGGLFGGLFA
jgi:archaellum biogenesis protein FlaJ (TadC family)